MSELLTKLHVAQKNASAVAKKGKNTAQHYDYARAEDVIKEAQKALHDAGLVGTMAFGNTDSHDIESNKGSAGIYITVQGELRIAEPDSGESISVPGFGAGIDYPGDKAVYKAMTGAAKYAYASALGIPFTDDPENETQDNSRRSGDGSDSGLATPKQRGAFTKAMNRAGVAEEYRLAILKGIAGDPPTKAGISKCLDILFDKESDLSGEERVEKLAEMAEAIPPSDVPTNLDDLPTVDEALASGTIGGDE